jgi:hypothetical protein
LLNLITQTSRSLEIFSSQKEKDRYPVSNNKILFSLPVSCPLKKLLFASFSIKLETIFLMVTFLNHQLEKKLEALERKKSGKH